MSKTPSEIKEIQEQHAAALGRLTIRWSLMEVFLDAILIVTIPLEKAVWQSVAYNVEFRDKIKMARSLGFVRKKNDQWFERLEACLNELDNEVRPLRNRYTHDVWLPHPEGMLKVQKDVRLTKPQSFQRVLVASHASNVTLEEIEAVTMRIDILGKDLLDLATLHNDGVPPLTWK